MTVFFAAGAALLFYICAIPVKFALLLRLGGGPGFGTGVSIFESRFALRSAHARALGKKKRRARKKGGLNAEKLQAAFRTAGHLLRRGRLERLRLEGSIALPDAAQTALICGSLNSLNAALQPLLPGRVNLQLQPQFSASAGSAVLCCIVSMPLGYIISAALMGAWHYLTGRLPHGKASH